MSIYAKYFLLIILQIVISENYFISALPTNVESQIFPIDRSPQVRPQNINFLRYKRDRKYNRWK